MLLLGKGCVIGVVGMMVFCFGLFFLLSWFFLGLVFYVWEVVWGGFGDVL